ncbi:hypothetical protein D3C85_1526050 [compost metagenome]
MAVRPSSSLALATSCTPGNCTTMRSAPCCWMTGSATPSSLMRLCRVLMFCFSAESCTRVTAAGFRAPSSNCLPFSSRSVNSRSGRRVRRVEMARSRSSVLAKVAAMPMPERSTPVTLIFWSRSTERTSADSES